jgi:hypothetical protein
MSSSRKKKPVVADTAAAAATAIPHVAFVLERLEADALTVWVEELVDSGLELAAKLTLGSVVGAAAIKRTARNYAVDLDVGGGIPELVGEIAAVLHAHPAHASTRLEQLLPEQQVRAMLDQGLELRALRERVLRGVLASPIYEEFVSDLLYHGIRDYLAQGSVTRAIPGARSAMAIGKALISKATPGLEASIEESLRKYIGRSVGALTRSSADFLLETLDEQTLREAVLDAWAQLRGMKLSVLRDDLSSEELQGVFVTSYEYWRVLRKTPFYSAMIDAGIDCFFDKYGKATLATLLEDIGITREMMIDEAMRYAPPVLRTLKRRKLLEPLLRQQLAPFYQSAAVSRILG